MRLAREVIPGFPHHVIHRGNNRRRLFSYPPDYLRFLWYLGHAVERGECEVNALVLMGNHVHLVIVPATTGALSVFVKSFAQKYAVYRNRKRRSSGKLFEERFYSVPIRSEAQLAITIGYIELNPVRAGLVKEPGDYPWSTYKLHCEGSRSKVLPEIWTPSMWYRELSAELETRRRIYKEWVEDCRRSGKKPDHVDEIEVLERISTVRYTLRLERPDRSGASEQISPYRELGRNPRLLPDEK